MKIKYLKYLIYIIVYTKLISCYSFTGGSKPEYLNSLFIAPVIDNSGYGNPKYREILAQNLVDKFQSDNSFQIFERNADARLTAVIKDIREEKAIVSQTELETERKIVVNVEVEYYDAINKKLIWKQQFSNFSLYQIASAQIGRDEAVKNILEKTSEDILFSVISGW